ncbi:uncharacterized protein V5649_002455 [Rhynchonycteris naso]
MYLNAKKVGAVEDLLSRSLALYSTPPSGFPFSHARLAPGPGRQKQDTGPLPALLHQPPQPGACSFPLFIDAPSPTRADPPGCSPSSGAGSPGTCRTTYWRGSSEPPFRAPAQPSASSLHSPATARAGPGPGPGPAAPQPRQPRSSGAPQLRTAQLRHGRQWRRSKLAGASSLVSPPPHLLNLLLLAAQLSCARLLEGEQAEESAEGWGKGERSLLELYLCSLGARIQPLRAAPSAYPFSGAQRGESLCNSVPVHTWPGMYRRRGAFRAQTDAAAAKAVAAASSRAP